ncbi:MAG: TIGR01777 family oxidoreductase [Planctomycetes bacterium]|nr:TIGR01777 family oxidoreductase [Planctomycetota bacterium]
MRALVTGATGFIGSSLISRLDHPVVLSRQPEQAEKRLKSYGVKVLGWDSDHEPPPVAAFEGIDVIFHLAGESVGEGRWNAEKKKRISDSRVNATRMLVETLNVLETPPKVLVSASAIGYYGSRGDQELDETALEGDDFLAEVCFAWEQAALGAEKAGIRVVTVRTGIVLGRGGGALAKMVTPFKLGLGGRLGSGQQWMSWIHIDDEVGLLLHAAEHPEISGAMNLVSPEPVTNRDFTRSLGRALGRPTIFPVPAFALKLAVGQFAEVLLGSQRVVPRVAQDTGYQFHYRQLDQALEQILSEGK